MNTKTVKIKGVFTANEAVKFAQKACTYESEIFIQLGNKKVNAKSIMGIISLGLSDGTEFILIANGIDEEKAIRELFA